VCFTTHPARPRDDAPYSTPGYWTGCGTLPRVAQIDNVVIAIYKIATRRGLYLTNRLLFTHAWLPRDRFDEVVEREGWVFARRGDGYLALRSQHPYRWQTAEGEDRDREVIVDGVRNIWICELGRHADSGTFDHFIDGIIAARIEWRENWVAYESPSQGQLEWGWRGPLRRSGVPLFIADYGRYENRFVQAPLPADRLRVEANGQWLEVDWVQGERSSSSLAGGFTDAVTKLPDQS
jgi:hypothetical protein